MIITLDYNNDSVSLQNEENDPTVVSWKGIKDLKTIQSILVELINMMYPNGARAIQPVPDILIQRIDEDTQTVIEEW